MIEFINSRKKFVFSVDVPSGLFSDTGCAEVCIRADATATFALPKLGLWMEPGASLRGTLEVVDIGIPRHVVEGVGPRHFLLDAGLAKAMIGPRPVCAHKGTTGHLLVIAGSPGKTGAACLAAHAALRAGAGLVTLAGPESLKKVFELRVTEAMTEALSETPGGGLDERAADEALALLPGKRCLAIGPGIGASPGIARFVARVVCQSPVPVVVDADALNALALDPSVIKKARSALVLTPHPGEMARLCGLSAADVQKDRLMTARRFALEYGATVVLKGAGSLIALPDGRVGVNSSGNPGMASAGMGDALTGIIGGLAAQGLAPEDAACAGVFLHGLAGDILAGEKGPRGFLATEVADAVPAALKRVLG